jgi:hypothetical protein
MERERSLACSQLSATAPTLNRMSPICCQFSSFLSSILLLSFHLSLGLSGYFLSDILTKILYEFLIPHSRSPWPRDLRHEMSSPARKLRSCVRILLEAWMFVYVYSVFVLYCVQADHTSKGSYRLIKKLKWNKVFHGCSMLQVGVTGIWMN